MTLVVSGTLGLKAREVDTVRVEQVLTEVTYLRFVLAAQCTRIQEAPMVPCTLRAFLFFCATLGVSGVWHVVTAGLAKQFDKKQQGLGVNTAKVYFAFTPSAADYVVVEGNKMVKLIKRTVN